MTDIVCFYVKPVFMFQKTKNKETKENVTFQSAWKTPKICLRQEVNFTKNALKKMILNKKCRGRLKTIKRDIERTEGLTKAIAEGNHFYCITSINEKCRKINIFFFIKKSNNIYKPAIYKKFLRKHPC